MATPKPKAARKPAASDSKAAVDAFMKDLAHPHKDAITALRKAMCAAAPSVAEGVKWNAPSFRTTEWFATTHLRAKSGIALVLHLGAKVRKGAGVRVADPEGLLTWLDKDRAMVSFADAKDVRARAAALQAVVRQWIAFV